MHNDAVVTGIGVVSAVGCGCAAFAASLRAGRSGITGDPGDGLGVAGRLQGFDFPGLLAGLGLPEATAACALRAGRRAPRSAQAGLIAALEAWHGSRAEGSFAPERVSLVVAGSNFNEAYQRSVMTKFERDPEYVPASYALHYMDTDQVGILSEVLGVRGEGLAVGGASASGNMGLIQGRRMIRDGVCDACVVVGAMSDISPVELRAFRHIGALGGKRFASEPGQACRPFDADREGFIPGQGSACLVLEAAPAARERGAFVWGRISGGAACLDGNRSSDPSVEGESRAMRQALDDAGRTPADVDYVNAHATSSVLGDEVEVKALRNVFGSRLANVPVNATKGLTGHCLTAAGVVEAAATLVQMRDGFVHPNANLENPIDPECRFVGRAAEPRSVRVALSNSFGFGGINTAIVIEREARDTSDNANG